MHDQEVLLVRKAQDGDVGSFEELIGFHKIRLFRLIMAVTGNAEDAEDALQETLLQAYRALPRFRGDSSFCTWLYRIAINRSRNWMRTQARASSERFAERMVGTAITHHLEDNIIESECRDNIKNGVLKLPEHYRKAILLRYYMDLAYDEIADVLGIPIGTVRSRLAQGRRLLMKELNAQGYGPNEGDGSK